MRNHFMPLSGLVLMTNMMLDEMTIGGPEQLLKDRERPGCSMATG